MGLRARRIEIAAVCVGLASAAAAAPDPTDLRDLKVGMPIAEISPNGYADLICRDGPPRKLAGWDEWRICPADAVGRHAIGFAFAEGTTRNGTRVGGHPAHLTLLVGEQARVEGLVIETDDEVPLYLRKKGHLLGLQARGHWGEEGWTCAAQQAAGDEVPLGDTFVKEECRKQLSDRTVTVLRELFHYAGRGPRAFVSRTRISVSVAR
ncbi:hypothetical protein [Methylobacterium oryzisoli]|uniref:hypothetical protein n=1 Tax=Methylobacterium oryzisoli TaxID=3385502 RepID=UPI003891AF40